MASRGVWWRKAAIALSLAVSNLAVPASVYAQDAKASLADADKAVKNKDWAGAAKAFDAANKATPSADALEGLANAHYNGGQLGESFMAYTEWNEKYGPKAAVAKKATVTQRLKELEGKTGALALTINEAGAAITIDDKPVGTSPAAAPFRLTPGPHHIRVSKDGFVAFDQAPNVSTGNTTTVDVKLAAATGKVKIAVKEKSGKAVRVIVDGVDQGDAPWNGEVEPGPHDITIRGMGLAAIPQKITAVRGKNEDLTFEASSASTAVKINTSDNKGVVYLDGKLVGEGSFVGDIPSGAHLLKITREGYDPFEETITFKDKEPYARVITLKLSSKIETGKVQEGERLDGLYGGFGFSYLLMPGGTHSSIQKQCENPPNELTCDVGGGNGGGFSAFIGYHWDPIGIELFAAGQYDEQGITNDWKAPATSFGGIGPDPARKEEYTIRRAGAVVLARIRADFQPIPKLRLSIAGGAGFSYRTMFLQRETTDGTGAVEAYKSVEDLSYVSPAVGLEPSVAFRVTKSVAVSLGLQVFFDAPSTSIFGGDNPQTKAQPAHVLVNPTTKEIKGTVSTPSYELASNMQVFIGPVLGMVFGP